MRAVRFTSLAAVVLGAVALVVLVAGPRGSPRASGKHVVVLGGDLHVGAAAPFATVVLAKLRDEIAGASVVVNLEGPVSGAASTTSDGIVVLANAPEFLPGLHDAGVRVAAIANNHARDAGPASSAETVAALRRAGILPAGLEAAAATFDTEGGRIVVTAHDLGSGVPPSLRADLRRARAGGAGTLIATFHVTGPPLYLPVPALKSAVAIALEEGAVVVAAHGTHALGPVERRGDRVIAWGLGNLAFACACTEETDALLLRVTISGGTVTRAEVIPIDAGLRGAFPVPASDPAAILDLLAAIGSTPIRREGARGVF